MGRLNCESCPFWDKANGCCYFPGDCTLPEKYEILKLMQKTKTASAYGEYYGIRAGESTPHCLINDRWTDDFYLPCMDDNNELLQIMAAEKGASVKGGRTDDNAIAICE